MYFHRMNTLSILKNIQPFNQEKRKNIFIHSNIDLYKLNYLKYILFRFSFDDPQLAQLNIPLVPELELQGPELQPFYSFYSYLTKANLNQFFFYKLKIKISVILFVFLIITYEIFFWSINLRHYFVFDINTNGNKQSQKASSKNFTILHEVSCAFKKGAKYVL